MLFLFGGIMPSEIFRILEVEGSLGEIVGEATSCFANGIMTSPELSVAIGLISGWVESVPILFAVILSAISLILLIFPSRLAKLLSLLYSPMLGFCLTLIYFPREAARGVPILVLAGAACILALILHRLISLISYFSLVGCLSYISAYTGSFFGFGKGDIFLSLIVSAVVILASLILLSSIRLVGITLLGGYALTMAISILIDLSLVFGGARDIAVAGISSFLALIAIRRYLKSRGKSDSSEGGHSDSCEA